MTWLQRAAVGVVCALGATQVGFETYETQSGIPIRWYADTVEVKADEDLCADLADEVTLRAIRESYETWNAVGCMQPRLVDGGLVQDVDPITGNGNRQKGSNLVIFEDTEAWLADDASGKGPGVIALTTLFYDPTTGQAKSYALEVNDGGPVTDDGFTFADGVVAGAMDLTNTLTHEFGHVLGLDHAGKQHPSATMYYSAAFGDVSKRTLEEDDRNGICSLYENVYAEIDRSEHDGGGGDCDAGTRPGPLAPLALVAGLLAFAWMRARRS